MLNYDLNEIKKKVKLNYHIYTSFNEGPLKYYHDDNIPMDSYKWLNYDIIYHKIPMQMAYDILIGKRDKLAELCGIIHININGDLQLHSDGDELSLVAYDIDQNNIARYWHKNGKFHRKDGPAIIDADGSKHWYRNGKLHREDGPAIIDADGSKWWYKNGKLHREDGPAIMCTNGVKSWYINGKLHREDNPAIIDVDGSKEWYKNGKLHREDGPAIMDADGSQFWYRNGKLYREDGPAIIYANGDKVYCLNNASYLKQDWEEKVAELRSKRDKEKS